MKTELRGTVAVAVIWAMNVRGSNRILMLKLWESDESAATGQCVCHLQFY